MYGSAIFRAGLQVTDWLLAGDLVPAATVLVTLLSLAIYCGVICALWFLTQSEK